MISKTAWGAGTALAAVLLSGCSVGATGGPSAAPSATAPTAPSVAPASAPADPTTSASTPASTPAAGTTPGSDTSASVGGGKDALPEGFPVPDGADVGTVVRDDNEIAAQITISDPAKAYDFWRSALPKAGYTVTKAETLNGSFGEIRFRGHGCTGNSQIAVTPSNAAVECDLG